MQMHSNFQALTAFTRTSAKRLVGDRVRDPSRQRPSFGVSAATLHGQRPLVSTNFFSVNDTSANQANVWSLISYVQARRFHAPICGMLYIICGGQSAQRRVPRALP